MADWTVSKGLCWPAFDLLAEWLVRHRRRRALAAMLTFDDRTLADIGIRRTDLEREIRKGFWQN